MKNEFYTDLLKAQTQIEEIQKDGKNPFFKSDYATLNATILACKKILNDNHFIILQPIQSDIDGVYVCTTLIHISGEKIESKMRVKAKSDNNPQDQGSAITYARRYSLQSFLLMSAVDDDGEKATNHNVTTPAQTVQSAPVVGLNKECLHAEFEVKQVQKEGANKGRYFKLCKDCNKFIGWTIAPDPHDAHLELTGHEWDNEYEIK